MQRSWRNWISATGCTYASCAEKFKAISIVFDGWSEINSWKSIYARGYGIMEVAKGYIKSSFPPRRWGFGWLRKGQNPQKFRRFPPTHHLSCKKTALLSPEMPRMFSNVLQQSFTVQTQNHSGRFELLQKDKLTRCWTESTSMKLQSKTEICQTNRKLFRSNSSTKNLPFKELEPECTRMQRHGCARECRMRTRGKENRSTESFWSSGKLFLNVWGPRNNKLSQVTAYLFLGPKLLRFLFFKS